jgi:hypothetical protein
MDPIYYLLSIYLPFSINLPFYCYRTDAFTFTSKLEGNTGFYFARSTPLTIKLWKEVFEAAPK